MGNMLKRKLKRTKMQEVRMIEGQNWRLVNELFQKQQILAKAIVDTQSTLLALINVLKKQRIVDDLAMQIAAGEIEKYQEMQRQALIIDPNRAPAEPEKAPEKEL